MTVKLPDKIIGHGGGGGSSSARTPVEAENSPGANTIAKLVDLIAEGEIGGPANGDSWYKSTYFNEIPVQNDDDSYNYSGVTLEGRNGTSTQEYLQGIEGVEATELVGNDVTVAGGAQSVTISDSNVDHAKVTIQIPTLMEQKSNGDLVRTKLQLEITVTPDNGAGTEQVVVDRDGKGLIYEKYTAAYRRQYKIENLSQYGSSPWVIKVYRVTPDSSSAKIVNSFSWYSYTKIIDVKLRYYDRAVVASILNAAEFGNKIPSRAYKVNGRKVKIPSNYDPVNHTYSGDWDGTFTVATTSNPAWIAYDLLTDPDVGLGLLISEDMVDKWTLYACGVYADQAVTVKTKTKQSDGTYSTSETTEPRFTFNGVIDTRKQGLEVISHVLASMRTIPIWNSGQISFVQDKPITTPARPVSPSNVTEHGFEYEGVPKRTRHSVVKVSWNNPDLFGRLDIVELVDEEAILNYGYNEKDYAAIACTSRTEAVRRAKYDLYTDVNTRQTVSFVGGLEWADCLPGELIAVQDPNFADITMEGRVKSATTTSITVDKTITIEESVTYTLLVQIASGGAEEVTLNNAAGDTDTLTWDTAMDEAPFPQAVFVISTSSVATREFIVISVVEQEKGFQVTGVEYDGDKYAEIEDGIVVEVPDNTDLLPEKLTPPTAIDVEAYSYTEGDQAVRKYGIQISWTPSTDPRVLQYEVMYKPSDGGWIPLGTTVTSNFDWRDVEDGVYDIRVRGVGVGLYSAWLNYADFTLNATLTDLAPPTNVDTVEGSGVFSGRDCAIDWTASVGSQFSSSFDNDVGDSNVSHYKVEVRKQDTTLLRTIYTPKGATSYTYTYADNVDDNNGTPLRALLFYVYTVDVFGDESTTYDSTTADNPAPDMSASTPIVEDKYGHLKISWSSPSDNDMDYFQVLLDSSNPPTTEVGKVKHPATEIDVHGLDYGTSYYARIVPYDLFGAGTQSNVSAAGNIVKIPSINLDSELEGSITMSDSDSNTQATLDALYDGIFGSGGVTYTLSGVDKYIQYQYGITNYFDRISVWVDGINTRAYVAYSEDGISWNYLKAQASHDLDSDGALEAASDQADARANYWELDTAGQHVALFPNNVTAKYIRFFLTGTYTETIYELVPSRILISELAAIKHLSSYSANLGTITAGLMRSSDGDMSVNLDDKEIDIYEGSDPVFTYSPASGLFLKGAFDIIGTSTVAGTLTVEGNIKSVDASTGDYAELIGGDLNFYYDDGGTPQLYQSVNRLESGMANNGDTVIIPGIFKNAPDIIIVPAALESYNPSQSGLAQEMHLDYENLQETSLGSRQYQFDTQVTLQTVSGTTESSAVSHSLTKSSSGTSPTSSTDNLAFLIPASISVVTLSGSFAWAMSLVGNDDFRGYCYVYLNVDGVDYLVDSRVVWTVNGHSHDTYSNSGSYSFSKSVSISISTNSNCYVKFTVGTRRYTSGAWVWDDDNDGIPDTWTSISLSTTDAVMSYYNPGSTQLANGSVKWFAIGE